MDIFCKIHRLTRSCSTMVGQKKIDVGMFNFIRLPSGEAECKTCRKPIKRVCVESLTRHRYASSQITSII